MRRVLAEEVQLAPAEEEEEEEKEERPQVPGQQVGRG